MSLSARGQIFKPLINICFLFFLNQILGFKRVCRTPKELPMQAELHPKPVLAMRSTPRGVAKSPPGLYDTINRPGWRHSFVRISGKGLNFR